ncbi:MAG: hypothetical protein RMK99_09160 [Anaerolineales bacterium]|nr:hypothetical protein [Anaerolineales bacterium]
MTPTKRPPEKTVNGHNVHYNGARLNGQPGGPPPGWPRKRTSVYPFLLDLGLVLAAFGLIILRPLVSELAGNVAIVIGVALAVVALVGWLREARAEYEELSD